VYYILYTHLVYCVCVCVCVWESERERENARIQEREKDKVHIYMLIHCYTKKLKYCMSILYVCLLYVSVTVKSVCVCVCVCVRLTTTHGFTMHAYRTCLDKWDTWQPQPQIWVRLQLRAPNASSAPRTADISHKRFILFMCIKIWCELTVNMSVLQ